MEDHRLATDLASDYIQANGVTGADDAAEHDDSRGHRLVSSARLIVVRRRDVGSARISSTGLESRHRRDHRDRLTIPEHVLNQG
jgi:hypothetical protein